MLQTAPYLACQAVSEPFKDVPPVFICRPFSSRSARKHTPRKKGKIKATTPGLFVVFFFLAVQTRHGVQESGSTVTRFSETIRVQTIPSVTFFFRLAVD